MASLLEYTQSQTSSAQTIIANQTAQGILALATSAEVAAVPAATATALLTTPANKIVTTTAGVKVDPEFLDRVSTAAPTSATMNFRQMMVHLWRRFFKKADLIDGTLTTYADDNSTAITTQAVVAVGDNQAQGPAT